jgi:hypothetical protein
VVQRCNCILKFTESTPVTTDIIEIDCVAQNRIYDSENDVFINLPRSKLNVTMPYDLNSIKIRVTPQPTRFLLGVQDWNGKYKP